MYGHDAFDWTNAIVGGVGLLLTVAAIVQATGAKSAARRAGKAVNLHTAENQFNFMAQLAQELHGHVEAGRLCEARLRTTDLRSELAKSLPHYEDFLGKHANTLKDKQFDLTLVAVGLNSAKPVLMDSERVRLLRITGAIREVLSSQCGELRSRVAREVGNG